jgi:predicted enzyme related to lactoylglutathione lyase
MYFVRDLNESIKFYEKVLAQSPSFVSDVWVEFDLGDQNLCLCPTKKNSAEAAGQHSSTKARAILEVDDLEKVRDQLVKMGIKIVDEIESTQKGSGRYFNVEDLDGNIIGLFSPNLGS